MNTLKLKRIIKNNTIGAFFISLSKRLTDWCLYQKRKPYITSLAGLSEGNLSIISSNCFAGRIMQDLEMEYNSPTLGLYFMYPDYIEFLSKLEHYLLESKITFVEHSKYALGDERRAKRTISHHWYPIGLLDGKVEIHFLHYHTEQEAAEKWYRRAKRVNLSNLLVIGMDQNLCTVNDIQMFNSLPFKRKIFFSTHDLPDVECNVLMKEFAGQDSVGDAYKKGHLFYRYLHEALKRKKT